MTRIVVFLLAGLAGDCFGQDLIIKCRDAKGAITVQNVPCEAGSKVVSHKYYDQPARRNGSRQLAYVYL
jgi:hypothetical protein